MVKYARNELLSVEKIAILKNNKIEAVVISTEKYEHLKEIEELTEQIELYKTIQEHKKTP